ncbi:MAG TPA: oligosaccharide flippase family protein [Phycisphaerae bacterium]|nr:oligosaccharide flippase family protein [Phycisphaerae bacterium]
MIGWRTVTQSPNEPNIPETGLAQRTVQGMVWTLIQILGSKAAGIVAQIFLARLLTHDDFGLLATTYAAAAIPNIFRQTGILQILVAKQKQFRRWAVHAFWLEFALGLVAMVGMCIAALIAVVFFRAPAQLMGMTAVVALGAGISSLGVLSNAQTLIELRFRQVSIINLYTNVLQSALSVAFAFCHFGAYSFILPLPIAAAMRVYSTWRLVHKDLPPIRWEINLARWRKLASGSATLIIASSGQIVTFIAYLWALSVFHAENALAVKGVWFFAWNLSNQIVQLLATNLANTLFPTLSKIKHDVKRQKLGFLRAAQALALITTFGCVLEALGARPGVEVFFGGTKWLAAVVPLQFFALATIFGVVASPVISIMMAQERYQLYLWYNILPPLTLIPMLFLGSWWNGVTGEAIATLVQSVLAAPLGVALVMGSAGKLDWLSPLKVFWGPLLCGAAGGAAVLIILNLFPVLSQNNIAALIVICGIFGVIYSAMAWMVCRPIVKELFSHADHLLHRFLRR